MRFILLGVGLLVGLGLLTGCGGGDVGALPTLVPRVEDAPGGASPRGTGEVSQPAGGNILPPTWTAVPRAPSPPTAEPSATPFTYTVEPGDTLGEIAERFDVGLEELARVNNISDVDQIEVGTVLIIPTN